MLTTQLPIRFILDILARLYLKLAETPSAAQVNLQLAKHLLFGKQFSKMCSSAFRVSGPPGPDEGGGGG